MAEMELRETSPGEFLYMWSASNEKHPSTDDLTPRWPEGCVAESNVVRCGSRGLRGTLCVDGVGKRYSAALVKVYWLDGQSHVYTLTPGQPRAQLYGSAEDHRSMGEIASAYTVLGIEHILTGFDHLLFVFGLLFLVGFQRKLLWTITAFTVAHSLTLASAALGLLTLRSPPVEATIANGRVYVGTAGEVDVYGLLGSVPTAATPVMSPASETFSGTISVSISDSTPGATIYYTTDGSDPRLVGGVLNPGAIAYSDSLNLSQSVNIRARVLNGTTWSALIDAKFIIVFTQTGFAARLMSKFRPAQPIIALTPSTWVARRMNILWGVQPFVLRDVGEYHEQIVDRVDDFLLSRDIVVPGDPLVILMGSPIYQRAKTNLLRVHRVKG